MLRHRLAASDFQAAVSVFRIVRRPVIALSAATPAPKKVPIGLPPGGGAVL
jgi:hypothetical protein